MPRSSSDDPDLSLPSVSVIIPVHNEEVALAITAPQLLAGLRNEAEVVYVCNGCTDDSAELLRQLNDPRVKIIEMNVASKAAALNEGERGATIFPRFYVDADVAISGYDIMRLAEYLHTHDVDLVSPALAFDMTDCSWIARAANRIWLQLPHGRMSAFQQVIGLSQAARARWGRFPDILADDSFMVSRVSEDRRMIVGDIVAEIRPPANFWALVGVRVRILRGLDQLQRLGIERPHAPRQGAEFLRLLIRPRTAFGAMAYIVIGLVARVLFMAGAGTNGWYRDESSRKPRIAMLP